jgi:hypothetical protein
MYSAVSPNATPLRNHTLPETLRSLKDMSTGTANVKEFLKRIISACSHEIICIKVAYHASLRRTLLGLEEHRIFSLAFRTRLVRSWKLEIVTPS